MIKTNSNIDALTGALTRTAFHSRLAEAIQDVLTHSGYFTMAFVDIDNFSLLNQAHGHGGGDQILEGVADVLRKVEGAELARYGGDEFALLFPGVEREQAFLRLEQARLAIAGLTQFGAGALTASLTISAGIAACPIDGADENELLRKVDAALYRAKVTGRNKIVLAYEERMIPKTAHFTQTQLERLSTLAKEQGVGEAVLLRQALDDLLVKYDHSFLSK